MGALRHHRYVYYGLIFSIYFAKLLWPILQVKALHSLIMVLARVVKTRIYDLNQVDKPQYDANALQFRDVSAGVVIIFLRNSGISRFPLS